MHLRRTSFLPPPLYIYFLPRILSNLNAVVNRVEGLHEGVVELAVDGVQLGGLGPQGGVELTNDVLAIVAVDEAGGGQLDAEAALGEGFLEACGGVGEGGGWGVGGFR